MSGEQTQRPHVCWVYPNKVSDLDFLVKKKTWPRRTKESNILHHTHTEVADTTEPKLSRVEGMWVYSFLTGVVVAFVFGLLLGGFSLRQNLYTVENMLETKTQECEQLLAELKVAEKRCPALSEVMDQFHEKMLILENDKKHLLEESQRNKELWTAERKAFNLSYRLLELECRGSRDCKEGGNCLLEGEGHRPEEASKATSPAGSISSSSGAQVERPANCSSEETHKMLLHVMDAASTRCEEEKKSLSESALLHVREREITLTVRDILINDMDLFWDTYVDSSTQQHIYAMQNAVDEAQGPMHKLLLTEAAETPPRTRNEAYVTLLASHKYIRAAVVLVSSLLDVRVTRDILVCLFSFYPV